MITSKFLRFPFVVCVPHTVNELVTDIILNITSQEDLMLTLLHIGLRLFELFSKEVRVNKQPGRPLTNFFIVAFTIDAISKNEVLKTLTRNELCSLLEMRVQKSAKRTVVSVALVSLSAENIDFPL